MATNEERKQARREAIEEKKAQKAWKEHCKGYVREDEYV